jgi:hypothetical protein
MPLKGPFFLQDVILRSSSSRAQLSKSQIEAKFLELLKIIDII